MLKINNKISYFEHCAHNKITIGYFAPCFMPRKHLDDRLWRGTKKRAGPNKKGILPVSCLTTPGGSYCQDDRGINPIHSFLLPDLH